VPAFRVRLHPHPGTATEQDVLDYQAKDDRLYELVDGTLVEKAVEFRESILAAALIQWLRAFVRPRKLGVVAAPDATLKLRPQLVRLPDVCFVSVKQLPGDKVPEQPIPDLYPDLAVEVLSKSNTQAEMARKRQEYFSAGTRLVWIVDPVRRTVSVYHVAGRLHTLARDGYSRRRRGTARI
jgi:Uma2 family endonuclease